MISKPLTKHFPFLSWTWCKNDVGLFELWNFAELACPVHGGVFSYGGLECVGIFVSQESSLKEVPYLPLMLLTQETF